MVDMPAKLAGLYRQRTSSAGAAVTLEVRASTQVGQRIYAIGSAGELGAWNVARAITMTPTQCQGSTCTWRVTLRYLPTAMSTELKFVKKQAATVQWEAGANRTLTVPNAPQFTFAGGDFR